MNDQLKTLHEVRNRLGARLADYDFKVLTLLFGIAAAWGVIQGISLPAGHLIAMFLAFAGLIVSVGWAIQRRMLWQVDESYADAIKATAAAGALAHGSAPDRPAAATGVRLHYGEPFSMAVFALLTGITIWSHRAPHALTEPDMAMLVPAEAAESQRLMAAGSGGVLTIVFGYPDYYADGEDCFCDGDFAAAPSSYGEEQYAPLSHGVVPFDPGSKKVSW